MVPQQTKPRSAAATENARGVQQASPDERIETTVRRGTIVRVTSRPAVPHHLIDRAVRDPAGNLIRIQERR